MKEILHTDWKISGKTMSSFERAIKEKEETTKFLRVKPGEVQIASVANVNSENIDIQFLGTDKCSPFTHKTPLSVASIPKQNLQDDGWSKGLIKEFTDVQKIGFLLNHKLILTAPSVDYAQFELGGRFFLKPSLERDLAIAKAITVKDKPFTMCCREDGTSTKCFAIRSGTYSPIPNNIIFNILRLFDEEDVGTVHVRSWEMDQYYTRLFVSFPDKAREIAKIYETSDTLIPGLVIETSDTGDCSLRVIGCFYVGNSVFYNAEVARKHAGDVKLPEILKGVRRNIFSKYTILPKRLVDLLMLNLNTSKGSQRAIYAEYIKDVAAFCDITKAVGKKIQKQIITELIDEYIEGEPFTAYDIAMQFMKLPERISGIPASSMRKLQFAVSKAAMYEFKDPEIMLLPA